MSSSKTYHITNRTRKEWRGMSPQIAVDLSSMNTWNTCGICNSIAIHPCCCPKGDVFCKECILEYLLSRTSAPLAATAPPKKLSSSSPTSVNSSVQDDKSKPAPQSKISPNDKHAKKTLCPICSKKLLWKNCLPLIYSEKSDGPICCACDKPMVGIIKAFRIPCGHVTCENCAKLLVNVDKQCPKCSQKFQKASELFLLNKSTIEQVGVGGRIVLSAPGLIMPFG